MQRIADDFVALSKRLNELEMERAKQLAEKVSAPAEGQNATVGTGGYGFAGGYGFVAADYDPA